jgi:hypothetical protein
MRGRRRDANLKHLDHLAAAGIHGVDHMDGVDGWLPRGWIQNDVIQIASWCRGDIDASGGDSSTTNSYMQGAAERSTGGRQWHGARPWMRRQRRRLAKDLGHRCGEET